MPRTVIVIIAVLAAAAGGIAYFSMQRSATEVIPVPGDSAPAPGDVGAREPLNVAFELDDLDGTKRSFAEWHGRHRIVNFWATWCAPCRREIPLLKAFQEQHAADGFQVIGVAVEWLEPVLAYAQEAQFNYPILVGEQDAMAVAESSGIPFVGLPFTMLVTRDGTLVGTHMGEIHQQQLDAIVTVLGQLDRGELDVIAARTALDLL